MLGVAYVGGEAQLVDALDREQLVDEDVVVGVLLKLGELLEVGDPARAYGLGYELGQIGVGL